MSYFRLLYVIALLVSMTALLPPIRATFWANCLIVAQNRAIWGHGSVREVSVNDRQSPSVLEVSGMAYLKTGNPILAERYLAGALAARPSRATTYVLLGDAHFAMGNDELALETWNHFDAKQILKWRHSIAAQRGDWEAVIRYLVLTTQIDPEDADAYSTLGDTYLRFDRRQESSAAYANAARLESDPYKSALLAGEAAYSMLDWDLALHAYQHAEQLCPQQSEPYYREGIILYWGLGKPEEAVRLLEKAIEIEPNNPHPYLTLVQLYDETRDYGPSDYWFEKVEAIAPNDPAVLYQPINSLMTRGEYGQVLPLIEQKLLLNPKNDSMWDLEGMVLMKLSRPADAELAYHKAVELMPTNGNYRIHYAQAQLSQGQYCEALKEAELAERLNPTVRFVTANAVEIRAAASFRCQ